MDITKFAEFITALGSLNGYASTIAETRQALEMRNPNILTRGANDAIIFTDAVRAIDAVKCQELSVDTIIEINKNFTGGGDEQPAMPGHLRNDIYNPEQDSVTVIVNEVTQESYFAKGVISREDIQKIVTEWFSSNRLGTDAWRLFARLSKLQPFQDGNKRTALIAANLAFGAFKTDNYLLIPERTSDRYRFTADLLDFYSADTEEIEILSLTNMLSWVDSSQLDAHSYSPNADSFRFTAQTKPFDNKDLTARDVINDLFATPNIVNHSSGNTGSES
jgi:hypothetical protein